MHESHNAFGPKRVATPPEGVHPTLSPQARLEADRRGMLAARCAGEEFSDDWHTKRLIDCVRFGLNALVTKWEVPPSFHDAGVYLALWHQLLHRIKAPTLPVKHASDVLWRRFPVDRAYALFETFLDTVARRGVGPHGALGSVTVQDVLAWRPVVTPETGTASCSVRYSTRIEMAVAAGSSTVARSFFDRLQADRTHSAAHPIFLETMARLAYEVARLADRKLLMRVGDLWRVPFPEMVRFQDEDQLTLLHAACSSNRFPQRRVALMRWLLAHGADPNASDHEGNTPLHAAAQSARTAAATALDVLDSAGANWQKQNHRNQTPLDLLNHGHLKPFWTSRLAERHLDAAVSVPAASGFGRERL